MANFKKKRLQGQESIKQIEHHDLAGSQATLPPVLAPGDVITSDLSAGTGTRVDSGSLLRIKVAGDTYVTFSDEVIGTVDATTSPGILLDTSVNGGWHIIRATASLIKTSVNPSRVENMGP